MLTPVYLEVSVCHLRALGLTTTQLGRGGLHTLAELRDLAEFFNISFDRLGIFGVYPFIIERNFDQEDVDPCESHNTFHPMVFENRPAP